MPPPGSPPPANPASPTRCILWRPPDVLVPPDLLLSLSRRNVQLIVCTHVHAAMAHACRLQRTTREPFLVLLVSVTGARADATPPPASAAAELLKALPRYAPRAACWLFDEHAEPRLRPAWAGKPDKPADTAPQAAAKGASPHAPPTLRLTGDPADLAPPARRITTTPPPAKPPGEPVAAADRNGATGPGAPPPAAEDPDDPSPGSLLTSEELAMLLADDPPPAASAAAKSAQPQHPSGRKSR